MQIAVGFVLVSLYHPYFLGFTLVMIAMIWAVWLIWGARALRTGVDLSHAKHATAAWLEQLGGSNGFFKSQRRIDYALDKTDDFTRGYIHERRRHFRHMFSQTVAFLLMYAAASAALLGLGGYLVVQNELTLGQLVAAELVLSAAFVGVSQLGSYLGYFYDLFAAVEEISQFYDVELEACAGRRGTRRRSSIWKSRAARSSWPPPAITGCSGCSPTCSRCTPCRRAASPRWAAST